MPCRRGCSRPPPIPRRRQSTPPKPPRRYSSIYPPGAWTRGCSPSAHGHGCKRSCSTPRRNCSPPGMPGAMPPCGRRWQGIWPSTGACSATRNSWWWAQGWNICWDCWPRCCPAPPPWRPPATPAPGRCWKTTAYPVAACRWMRTACPLPPFPPAMRRCATSPPATSSPPGSPCPPDAGRSFCTGPPAPRDGGTS